jgi:acyl-CoA reductase-like NAD-dependent aldehyde dehydrogenase
MSTELLVVGGEQRAAANEGTFDVIEPATGAPMAQVAEAGPEDARRAVDIAVRGLRRGAVAADERHRTRTGAAQGHRSWSASGWRTWPASRPGTWGSPSAMRATSRHRGEHARVLGRRGQQDLRRDHPGPGPRPRRLDPRAVGVCALITPWNFPLVIATWKIAPALACGNTIIVKPASYTPLSVLRLADILLEAGLPPEAMSVLPGPGSSVGNALVGDPAWRRSGSPGRPRSGSKIMAMAARNITGVVLELGGKSANVVFADADMEPAVERSVWAVFGNTGQDCCARSRVFVERPAYDDFVSAMAARTDTLTVGPPLEDGTDLGPMISAGQRQTSLDYLEIGQKEGPAW